MIKSEEGDMTIILRILIFKKKNKKPNKLIATGKTGLNHDISLYYYVNHKFMPLGCKKIIPMDLLNKYTKHSWAIMTITL